MARHDGRYAAQADFGGVIMKRFNPKDYPLSDFQDVFPVYVDDLALIERIGSTVRLSFAARGK
jgi:hypothetical protein